MKAPPPSVCVWALHRGGGGWGGEPSHALTEETRVDADSKNHLKVSVSITQQQSFPLKFDCSSSPPERVHVCVRCVWSQSQAHPQHHASAARRKSSSYIKGIWFGALLRLPGASSGLKQPDQCAAVKSGGHLENAAIYLFEM